LAYPCRGNEKLIWLGYVKTAEALLRPARGHQRRLRHCMDLIIRKIDLEHVSEPSFSTTKQFYFDSSRRGVDLCIE